MLSPVQLAKLLGVSERTARSILARGEIASHLIGGLRRIAPADVESYLAERRQEGRR